MPVKRSGYSLISQNAVEDHHPSRSAPPQFPGTGIEPEKNKARTADGVFGWTDSDHRTAMAAVASRAVLPLQRQSSGSSVGECSLSGGDHQFQSLSPSVSMSGNDVDLNGDSWKSGEVLVRADVAVAGSLSSSSRSWAQQAEESYQLQLALALRLSATAASAEDPNFLDSRSEESSSSSPCNSAESMSYRFWVNGCLYYHDKVPDGFYIVQGIDPYVWSVCTDLQESGQIPTIESLRAIDSNNLPVEVVLVDKQIDVNLRTLQNKAVDLRSSCSTIEELVQKLAELVCNHMGGPVYTEDKLTHCWKGASKLLKDQLGSVVLPLGNLSVGICKHRALLFKVLADAIDFPCRVARGCKHCGQDDASSCLIRIGTEKEQRVDLIAAPGSLCCPDSLLNGPYSISIPSPLRPPNCKALVITESFNSLAKQYFQDCQSLHSLFQDNNQKEGTESSASKNYRKQTDRHVKKLVGDMKFPEMCFSPIGDINLAPAITDERTKKNVKLNLGHNSTPIKSRSELSFDTEDIDIQWSDLVLKEKIGAGSFGTVHRADWHGSDVAVKILMEQDFHEDRLREFLREVAIMKRLRHPNIVLFMGAVTRPPNLSIVTEFLSRGSLYKLLHRSGMRELIDERRRLNMAYDVAKGMNYLHRRNPPIVHRDLKSPNLLVDKKWTVKVCDFGLSRLKANTFLSSKSTAGTPEWMAPEVLRDEPSNEKADVYSFGVILWELVTMQQPWNSLNPAQVVAAVGFQNRRLQIPNYVNPKVTTIIEACWSNEPWKRPSFSSVMESLKVLTKPLASQPIHEE